MTGRTMGFPPGRQRVWPVTVPVLMGLSIFVAACEPTVRVEAPDRPIEINLNVRIEQ